MVFVRILEGHANKQISKRHLYLFHFLKTITPGVPILFSLFHIISPPRIDHFEYKNVDPPEHEEDGSEDRQA